MATCCNSPCTEIYKAALSDIPSKWAEQIANLLCQLDSDKYSGISCDKVQECETLTAITDFSLNGNTVSLSYRDENENVTVKTLALQLGSFIQNQFTGNQVAEFWINGRGRMGSLDITGTTVTQNGLHLAGVNSLGISTNGGLVTTIGSDALMTHTGDIFLQADIGDEPAISFFLNSLAGSDYFIQRRGTTLDFHAAGIAQISVNTNTAYTANSNALQGHEWYSMETPTNNNLMQLFPDGTLMLMTTTVQQTPDPAIILDVVSSTRGVGFPNVTTAEKTAIVPLKGGVVVFDTDLEKLCVFTISNGWETITSI